MGKVTERDIAEFALDFINKLSEIDEDYLDYWDQYWEIRFGNVKFTFLDIRDSEWMAEDMLRISAQAKAEPENEEPDVREFTDNEHCVAYLVIEGDLYEKMYYCQGYGAGGEEAQKYLDALDTAVQDHNMRYDWAGGAIILYDIDDIDAGVVG